MLLSFLLHRLIVRGDFVQLAIVIKDQRMQLLYDYLCQKATVFAIRKSYDVLVAEKQAQQFDAIILPMSGVDENGCIALNNQYVPILNFLRAAKKGVYVFTGVIHPVLLQQGWTLINVTNFEEVRKLNADLTAQGILDMLIMQTPRDFRQYRYDVLGFGACGKAISELLVKNGCAVQVISRQEVAEAPCSMIHYDLWIQCQPADVIINTAHACMIKQETVAGWQRNPIIIDIATHGMGVEKGLQEKFKVIVAPSLPAITGPETSATLLFEIIEKELNL